MKLSIETWVQQDAVGYEDAIRMTAEAGFDACDFSYYAGKSLKEAGFDPERDLLGDDYLRQAERLRSVLDSSGIACNQAHAPFSFTRQDRVGEGSPKWEAVCRSIRSAAVLGAECIVVHAVGNEHDPDFTEFNRAFYESFAAAGAEAGIRIGVENLFYRDPKRRRFGRKLGTPAQLSAFVSSLDPRRFCACVDLGHAALEGFEPEEFIRGMDGSVLRALHVHDNNYLDDEHLLPWGGGFDWDAVISALASAGYAGDMTLEVLGFLKRYDTSMLPTALKFAEITGRELIARFERARASE